VNGISRKFPMSDDLPSANVPSGDRPASDLPYGVDTIVIPFTWSGPRWRRLPWRRFGGYKWVKEPYPPSYVGQSSAIEARQFAMALKDARQTTTDLALSALSSLRAGTAGGAGAPSPGTQAVRVKGAADVALSGGSGTDHDWDSLDGNTERSGATAADQTTAISASSPLSGASPPTADGTVATADGAAAAAVGKPNDPTAPVPVLDDQGKPILIPAGPDKGKPMLRPAGLDPHFFVNQGTADKSYYDALINNPSPNPLGGGEMGPAILSREFMQLSKLNRWRVGRTARRRPVPPGVCGLRHRRDRPLCGVVRHAA